MAVIFVMCQLHDVLMIIDLAHQGKSTGVILICLWFAFPPAWFLETIYCSSVIPHKASKENIAARLPFAGRISRMISASLRVRM